MEITIRTMMIIVLGVIALLILLTLFMSGQSEGSNIMDGIFQWFKVLGSG
jgi:hypothetical protein